jgi:hypothetical protein
MQLFIDIDGVLLNFERSFVRWINGTRGLGLPADYQAENWDFEELLDRETMQACWLGFLESDEVGAMAPLVDPARFNTLADAHSLHLVTNFPRPFMAKRLGNLQHHGFRFHSLDCCGLHAYQGLRPVSKAEAIGQRLRNGQGALFVDDHPDNCLDVLTHCPGVEVWLMSRRFNRDFRHPGIRRAADWGSLFERLENGGPPGAARSPGTPPSADPGGAS